jgi:outer membrane lipoprotein-sorting protein
MGERKAGAGSLNKLRFASGIRVKGPPLTVFPAPSNMQRRNFKSFTASKGKEAMRKKLLVLFLALVPVLIPGAVAAQSAEEVVAKYVTARGGLSKIRAIRSERVVGTISFGPGTDGPLLVERERPMKMYLEVNVNGRTLIRCYDGKSSGWIYNPFVPNPSVQAMSENDLKNIFDEADFEGPFVDYKEKGNKIEYLGKADVEGNPAQKLKLTNKNGEVSYYFFDVASNLPVKWEGTRKVGEKDVPWESYFRDFRDVSGFKYPFVIESDAPGTEQIQKIVSDKIEVNVSLDENHFGKPKPPPAPSETADPAKKD